MGGLFLLAGNYDIVFTKTNVGNIFTHKKYVYIDRGNKYSNLVSATNCFSIRQYGEFKIIDLNAFIKENMKEANVKIFTADEVAHVLHDKRRTVICKKNVNEFIFFSGKMEYCVADNGNTILIDWSREVAEFTVKDKVVINGRPYYSPLGGNRYIHINGYFYFAKPDQYFTPVNAHDMACINTSSKLKKVKYDGEIPDDAKMDKFVVKLFNTRTIYIRSTTSYFYKYGDNSLTSAFIYTCGPFIVIRGAIHYVNMRGQLCALDGSNVIERIHEFTYCGEYSDEFKLINYKGKNFADISIYSDEDGYYAKCGDEMFEAYLPMLAPHTRAF